MTEPQAHDATADSTGLPSPGALLRAAREKAGLTAEDLGGQLKLAKGTLEALERDDFGALSEPVYVRGYYRKIAKLLPVSEKALIDAYNTKVKPAAPRVTVTAAPSRIPLAGGVAAGSSSKFPYAGYALGIVAILIGIAMFVFIGREPARRIAPPEVASAPAQTAPAPSEPVQGLTPSPEPAPAATATPSTTSGPTAAAPAPAAQAPAPSPPVGAATSPAQQSAPRAQAQAQAPAAAVPAVAGQLVLTFSDSSFVRVEDSRGKTLAIGLVKAGERQSLDGTPPYTVFLGNAKNVKVHFGGQPVDFSAHVNATNDTARFMVP